ncbi:alpha,alpha-trehalose-phosphate synthase (UDP-forming) [Halostella litorea]|uniref:alpha,alpha-trehalose-phosphate synthase (UDP-forming) n=1 Tax=Halostella litorea TaxID=2528831 RepID=UPI00192A4B96|nr:trehalose-6-phosphate synthase [Halostella litorea]
MADGSAAEDGNVADAVRAVESLDGAPIVVSNREPYSHGYDDDDGGITVDRPAGGLTAALDPVMQTVEGSWVAWGDGEADREASDDGVVSVPPDDPSYDLHRVWLTDEQLDGYYRGISNRTLWPLCHSDTARVHFSTDDWERYRTVNCEFASAVTAAADGTAPVVWFQDYHLALAPRVLRERLLPDAFAMHFWHLPWPSWDVFRVCPRAVAVLDGLLANDLLGFHTPDYCRQFLDCAERALDAAVDRENGIVRYRGGSTTVRPFRLGIDADAIRDRAETPAAADFWDEFRADHGIGEHTQVALGVDRLDYTKGIERRFDALERLWERSPEWRGRLTFVQKGAKSRSSIPAYSRLQGRITERIEAINERFGTEDWQPVVFTTAMLSEDDLAGLYRGADLMLITPVRDGMNLVAKEYVASQVDDPGVLVLSEFAGAAEELDEGAMIVNPYDVDAVADAVARGLRLPDAERAHRAATLDERVHENDVFAWITRQFRTARAVQQGKRYTATRGRQSQ